MPDPETTPLCAASLKGDAPEFLTYEAADPKLVYSPPPIFVLGDAALVNPAFSVFIVAAVFIDCIFGMEAGGIT